METATREIYWNLPHPANQVVMYLVFAIALVVAAVGVFRHVELWLQGKPAPEFSGRWIERCRDAFLWVVLQRGVVKDRFAAWAHTLIYLGFLVLLFTTTMVFIHHDLGLRIYQGDFYLAVTVASDFMGLGLLLGLGIAAHRRYIVRADQVHSRGADSFLLGLLALLIVQGFLLEGLRIHVTGDPWAKYSLVGYIVSKFFWALSENSARLLHYLTWWFHSLTVFAGFALLPYSKLFHIVGSSLNLFFRSSLRAKGALSSPGDLEKLMESGEEFSLGLGSIKDYSWKQLLELDACTSCGRCQDVCPAYRSGKPLSPKWLILDTRNHALALNQSGKLGSSKLPGPLVSLDRALSGDFFLKSSGLSSINGHFEYSDPSFRGKNKLVQASAKKIGESPEQRIVSEVLDQNVFWSCTTCMACVEACPVGINHVEQIVGNRRNSALMHGELPSEAQSALKGLESRGNPFGPPSERTKWLEGLDVRELKAGDSVDYLYWVGCISAFDPRKAKIARALVKLMRAANLSFGVLGKEECCTGDPARRLGEENLFQTLAKKNIATLSTVKFKTLVANCPHCFNTIKNEYPQIGRIAGDTQPEVIHHSVLLQRLLAAGKLKLREGAQEFTFHDPCYLGRYNDEVDAPRAALGGIKGLKILEMGESRKKAMCCGAGGGHYFMDLKIGSRVNVLRTEQAAETGANKIATACPFCMQMMEDGVKLTNREETMIVRDIAEVLAEALA